MLLLYAVNAYFVESYKNQSIATCVYIFLACRSTSFETVFVHQEFLNLRQSTMGCGSFVWEICLLIEYCVRGYLRFILINVFKLNVFLPHLQPPIQLSKNLPLTICHLTLSRLNPETITIQRYLSHTNDTLLQKNITGC